MIDVRPVLELHDLDQLLRLVGDESVAPQLRRMGYTLEFERLTSGPITAIWLDRAHRTFWGAASNHGEDYGIAW